MTTFANATLNPSIPVIDGPGWAWTTETPIDTTAAGSVRLTITTASTGRTAALQEPPTNASDAYAHGAGQPLNVEVIVETAESALGPWQQLFTTGVHVAGSKPPFRFAEACDKFTRVRHRSGGCFKGTLTVAGDIV